MRPGHLDHRINNGAGIGSIDRIAEQPVLSSHCKRTDRVFTQIVCKAAASVFQIGFGCIPAVHGISHCLVHTAVSLWSLLVQPRPKSLKNWFFLLETQLFSFLVIAGIFLVDGIFDRKQPATVLDSLYSRLAVIILLSFWYSINEIPAYVRPAGTPFDPWQAVITLIAVCFQISMVAIQELSCMTPAAGRRIAIQDDHWKAIFPTPEQPHERLALGSAPLFMQHLYAGLICHCKTTLQKLPVEVIIQWLEIMLCTINDPVCKGCTADLGRVLFPVFFLALILNNQYLFILLHF